MTKNPTTHALSSARSSVLDDADFGPIAIRRIALSRSVRLRLLPDGRLSATMPKRAPLYILKKLVDSSRAELLKQVTTTQSKRLVFTDGQEIGRSHRLAIRTSTLAQGSSRLAGQNLIVNLPDSWSVQSTVAQDYIRQQCLKALKKEAKSYLPRRLRYLADHFDFSYSGIRYGNPKGRWGSYSTNGTISLNVALMNLPLEVIDYVLVHELCHSRHHHHQPVFWQEVERCLPSYKVIRKSLKAHSPYL